MEFSANHKDIKLIKSKKFAVEVINIYGKLLNAGLERSLATQLLRSGTSIGANLRESVYAVSKADFVNKCRIALKEAEESSYWLELFYETHFLDDDEFARLYGLSTELVRILSSISASMQ